MTDHQQDAGPVDVPAAEASTQDRLRAVLIDNQEEAAPVEEAPLEEEVSEEAVESEELEADDFEEEGSDDDGGPDETATSTPYGYNAEERDWFASLEESDQQTLSAIEARRNADVTKVTTKAAEEAKSAKQAAEQRAAQAAIEAKQNFANQLDQFVVNFAPQAPDPVLAQTNPAEYIALKAQYDAQIGQFDQLKHQIAGIGQEAQEESQKAFVEQRDKALMQIPEIANEETRQDYLDRVFDDELHTALGYTKGEVAQIADADDVKRLKTIADWREKAAKYDNAMKRKMKPVRAAKLRSTKPGAAQEQSSKNRALQEAKARQKASGGRDGTREALAAVLFN